MNWPKFSVYYFYHFSNTLPWIDLAALRCPVGGRLRIYFKTVN